MNVKSFLIGAAVAIVSAALGVILCCTLCCKKCDKGMPMPPCPQEQQCQKPSSMPGQHHGRPEGPRGDFKGDKCHITKMADQLNLTEEQKQQVKAIHKATKDAIRVARENADTQFEALLTNDQKAELAKIKAATKCDKKKIDRDDD